MAWPAGRQVAQHVRARQDVQFDGGDGPRLPGAHQLVDRRWFSWVASSPRCQRRISGPYITVSSARYSWAARSVIRMHMNALCNSLYQIGLLTALHNIYAARGGIKLTNRIFNDLTDRLIPNYVLLVFALRRARSVHFFFATSHHQPSSEERRRRPRAWCSSSCVQRAATHAVLYLCCEIVLTPIAVRWRCASWRSSTAMGPPSPA
jgi:hypothetical protein